MSTITRKDQMHKLMQETLVEHGVTSITLPKKPGTREEDVVVPIAEIDPSDRAAKSKPRVPSMLEMKDCWLTEMKAHSTLKKMLECKLERFVKDQGGQFLWTPPYTPTLQPIEEFWGAGKNYVAECYLNGRTMKQLVQQLQDGWYGTAGTEREHLGKQPCPCDKLVERAVQDANRRLKEVGGLTGSMRAGVRVVDEGSVFSGTSPNDMHTAHTEVGEQSMTVTDPESPTENQPHVLDEEESAEGAAQALEEGSGEIEEREPDPGLRAPVGSPARSTRSHRRR